MKHRYENIPKEQVPANVRFDIPRQNQGQIVEVAYGGFGRAEHGPGDLYRRTIDHSEPNASENAVYGKLKA